MNGEARPNPSNAPEGCSLRLVEWKDQKVWVHVEDAAVVMAAQQKREAAPPEEDKSAPEPADRRVLTLTGSFDGAPNDDNHHRMATSPESLEVPSGHALEELTASCTWNDQGWGNQKGQVFLRVWREGKELGTPRSLFGIAGHSSAPASATLAFDLQPNDKLDVWVIVGGGGGHTLNVQNFKLEAKFTVTKEKADTPRKQALFSSEEPHETPANSGDLKWACPSCTFLNDAANTQCSICQANLPADAVYVPGTERDQGVEESKTEEGESNDLAKILPESQWDWMHDGQNKNGEILFRKDGVLKAFGGHSTWSVTGRREVTCADIGGAGVHVLTFDEGVKSFSCSHSGQKGVRQESKEYKAEGTSTKDDFVLGNDTIEVGKKAQKISWRKVIITGNEVKGSWVDDKENIALNGTIDGDKMTVTRQTFGAMFLRTFEGNITNKTKDGDGLAETMEISGTWKEKWSVGPSAGNVRESGKFTMKFTEVQIENAQKNMPEQKESKDKAKEPEMQMNNYDPTTVTNFIRTIVGSIKGAPPPHTMDLIHPLLSALREYLSQGISALSIAVPEKVAELKAVLAEASDTMLNVLLDGETPLVATSTSKALPLLKGSFEMIMQSKCDEMENLSQHLSEVVSRTGGKSSQVLPFFVQSLDKLFPDFKKVTKEALKGEHRFPKSELKEAQTLFFSEAFVFDLHNLISVLIQLQPQNIFSPPDPETRTSLFQLIHQHLTKIAENNQSSGAKESVTMDEQKPEQSQQTSTLFSAQKVDNNDAKKTIPVLFFADPGQSFTPSSASNLNNQDPLQAFELRQGESFKMSFSVDILEQVQLLYTPSYGEEHAKELLIKSDDFHWGGGEVRVTLPSSGEERWLKLFGKDDFKPECQTGMRNVTVNVVQHGFGHPGRKLNCIRAVQQSALGMAAVDNSIGKPAFAQETQKGPSTQKGAQILKKLDNALYDATFELSDADSEEEDMAEAVGKKSLNRPEEVKDDGSPDSLVMVLFLQVVKELLAEIDEYRRNLYIQDFSGRMGLVIGILNALSTAFPRLFSGQFLSSYVARFSFHAEWKHQLLDSNTKNLAIDFYESLMEWKDSEEDLAGQLNLPVNTKEEMRNHWGKQLMGPAMNSALSKEGFVNALQGMLKRHIRNHDLLTAEGEVLNALLSTIIEHCNSSKKEKLETWWRDCVADWVFDFIRQSAAVPNNSRLKRIATQISPDQFVRGLCEMLSRVRSLPYYTGLSSAYQLMGQGAFQVAYKRLQRELAVDSMEQVAIFLNSLLDATRLDISVAMQQQRVDYIEKVGELVEALKSQEDLAYFYEFMLGERLLRGRQFSLRYEKWVLGLLDSAHVMGKAHRMLDDMGKSTQVNEDFQTYLLRERYHTRSLEPNAKKAVSLVLAKQFCVALISHDAWPGKAIPKASFKPAPQFTAYTKILEEFYTQYKEKPEKSRLIVFPMAGCVTLTKRSCPVQGDAKARREVDITVTPLQATILLAFNQRSSCTVQELATISEASLEDVVSAVRSLVHPSHAVLVEQDQNEVRATTKIDPETKLVVNDNLITKHEGGLVLHRIIDGSKRDATKLAQIAAWRMKVIEGAVVKAVKGKEIRPFNEVVEEVKKALQSWYSITTVEVHRAIEALRHEGLVSSHASCPNETHQQGLSYLSDGTEKSVGEKDSTLEVLGSLSNTSSIVGRTLFKLLALKFSLAADTDQIGFHQFCQGLVSLAGQRRMTFKVKGQEASGPKKANDLLNTPVHTLVNYAQQAYSESIHWNVQALLIQAGKNSEISTLQPKEDESAQEIAICSRILKDMLGENLSFVPDAYKKLQELSGKQDQQLTVASAREALLKLSESISEDQTDPAKPGKLRCDNKTLLREVLKLWNNRTAFGAPSPALSNLGSPESKDCSPFMLPGPAAPEKDGSLPAFDFGSLLKKPESKDAAPDQPAKDGPAASFNFGGLKLEEPAQGNEGEVDTPLSPVMSTIDDDGVSEEKDGPDNNERKSDTPADESKQETAKQTSNPISVFFGIGGPKPPEEAEERKDEEKKEDDKDDSRGFLGFGSRRQSSDKGKGGMFNFSLGQGKSASPQRGRSKSPARSDRGRSSSRGRTGRKSTSPVRATEHGSETGDNSEAKTTTPFTFQNAPPQQQTPTFSFGSKDAKADASPGQTGPSESLPDAIAISEPKATAGGSIPNTPPNISNAPSTNLDPVTEETLVEDMLEALCRLVPEVQAKYCSDCISLLRVLKWFVEINVLKFKKILIGLSEKDKKFEEEAEEKTWLEGPKLLKKSLEFPCKLMVIAHQGALIRNGVDIDSSSEVRRLALGEVVEAIELVYDRTNIPRYHIRHEDGSEGYISQHLRGGNYEDLVFNLSDLPSRIDYTERTASFGEWKEMTFYEKPDLTSPGTEKKVPKGSLLIVDEMQHTPGALFLWLHITCHTIPLEGWLPDRPQTTSIFGTNHPAQFWPIQHENLPCRLKILQDQTPVYPSLNRGFLNQAQAIKFMAKGDIVTVTARSRNQDHILTWQVAAGLASEYIPERLSGQSNILVQELPDERENINIEMPGSGDMNFDEQYQHFEEVLGIREAANVYFREAFQRLDTNSDGLLTDVDFEILPPSILELGRRASSLFSSSVRRGRLESQTSESTLDTNLDTLPSLKLTTQSSINNLLRDQSYFSDPAVVQAYAGIEGLLKTWEEKLFSTCKMVSEALKLPFAHAQLLLSLRNWDHEDLLDAYLKRPLILRHEAGLPPSSQRVLASVPTSAGDINCQVCFEQVPADDCLALWCNHWFCKECWYGFVEGKVKERTVVPLQCPMHNCHAAITTDAMEKMELGSVLMDAYRRECVRHYVERSQKDQPKIAWCRNPRGCEGVLSLEQNVSLSTLQCGVCGYQFCFRCDLAPHAPASCLMMQKWSEKDGFIEGTEEEMENRKIKHRTTKPCPKCGVPIEKNGGCSHMTCTQGQGGCGYEFCWHCLGDYHTTGDCSRPIVKGGQGSPLLFAELDKEVANHFLGVRVAEKHLDTCTAKLREARNPETMKMLSIKVEGWSILIMNLRALAYSTVLNYFLPDIKAGLIDRYKFLFKSLEEHTQWLQTHFEKNWQEKEGSDPMRQTAVQDSASKAIAALRVELDRFNQEAAALMSSAEVKKQFETVEGDSKKKNTSIPCELCDQLVLADSFLTHMQVQHQVFADKPSQEGSSSGTGAQGFGSNQEPFTLLCLPPEVVKKMAGDFKLALGNKPRRKLRGRKR